MCLREIRKNKNLTQRELAQRSGVNFRSLQDYEQGHKKLASASGDVLMRLSIVLGCAVEDLLLEDVGGALLLSANKVETEVIHNQRFYSEKYQTTGRWFCSNNRISTVFYYNGIQYAVPFLAVFTPTMLPCLMEAAVLQMEGKIESIMLRENGFESW